MARTGAWLRRAHRWLGIAAALLFLSVATTGVVLQVQQMFGAEEEQKERLAELTSPARLQDKLVLDPAALERARLALAQRFGNRPVDSIDWQIKGGQPFLTFHLGGGEPLKAEVELSSGRVRTIGPDGESWLLKLHTGEIVGDAGKVLGLFWGLALIAMLATGLLVYAELYRARRRGRKAGAGWRRFFWSALPPLLLLQATGPARVGAEPAAASTAGAARPAGPPAPMPVPRANEEP